MADAIPMPQGGVDPAMLARAAAPPGAAGGAPGQPPPGMRPPPAAIGAAGAPGAQLGNLSMAQQKVGIALKAMEEALPMIPMGSPFHTKLLKITNDLAREMQSAKADPGMQMQQMIAMIKQQQQAQPMASLARLVGQPNAQTPPVMPQGAGGGAPPGAAAA